MDTAIVATTDTNWHADVRDQSEPSSLVKYTKVLLKSYWNSTAI